MSITDQLRKPVLLLCFSAACTGFVSTAQAGAQANVALSASVRAILQRAVSDQGAPKLAFASQQEAQFWLSEMSDRFAS